MDLGARCYVKEKETLKRIISKNSLTKKCPLCNLFFEKRSNLRRHVLRNNVLANVICMQMKLYFLALFLVEYQMQSMQFKSNVRVYFHVWFHQKKYSFYPIYANFNYLLLFSWHLNWTIWYLWKKKFCNDVIFGWF